MHAIFILIDQICLGYIFRIYLFLKTSEKENYSTAETCMGPKNVSDA